MRTANSGDDEYSLYDTFVAVFGVILPPAALFPVIPVGIAGTLLAFCLYGIVMDAVNLVGFNAEMSWSFVAKLVMQLTGAAASILVPYAYDRLLRRLPPALQVGELSAAVCIGLTWLTYFCVAVVITIQLFATA